MLLKVITRLNLKSSDITTNYGWEIVYTRIVTQYWKDIIRKKGSMIPVFLDHHGYGDALLLDRPARNLQ